MLTNIEFYNTPEGDVIVKGVNEAARSLKENDRDIIDYMLTVIRDRYPKAHGLLWNYIQKEL